MLGNSAQLILQRMRNDQGADYERWLFKMATSNVLRHQDNKFQQMVNVTWLMSGHVDLFVGIKQEVLDTREETWHFSHRDKGTQREVNTIVLRSSYPIGGWDDQKAINENIADLYPATMSLMSKISEEKQSIVGKAMFARLKPNSQVYPHYDRGFYYLLRDRYHLVIQSQGSKMRCMHEEQVFQQGELWWFNNSVEHEAWNPSSEPRIHLIFDLLPRYMIPTMNEILETFK